jgi:hypothetical protein
MIQRQEQNPVSTQFSSVSADATPQGHRLQELSPSCSEKVPFEFPLS